MGHVRCGTRRRWRFKVTVGTTVSFTTDVSTGGFCTELMRVLPSTTRIRGWIEGFGNKVPFEGRVAWSSPGDASLSVRGRMGVSFTEVGPELLELFKCRSRLTA
jgi:hypothetical protein